MVLVDNFALLFKCFHRRAFSLRTKGLLNLYSGHLLYIPRAVRQSAISVLTGRIDTHPDLSLVGFLDTPSQRVQFILGTEEDEEHVPHELFTELDEICMREGEDAEWKETAR